MIRALILSLAMALPAAAQEWPNASRILIPPERFDHRVNPYQGTVTIRNVPRDRVGSVCGLGPKALACAIVHSPLRCTIILPQGAPIRLRKAMLRHELGHCNCDGPACWSHPDRTH